MNDNIPMKNILIISSSPEKKEIHKFFVNSFKKGQKQKDIR